MHHPLLFHWEFFWPIVPCTPWILEFLRGLATSKPGQPGEWALNLVPPRTKSSRLELRKMRCSGESQSNRLSKDGAAVFKGARTRWNAAGGSRIGPAPGLRKDLLEAQLERRDEMRKRRREQRRQEQPGNGSRELTRKRSNSQLLLSTDLASVGATTGQLESPGTPLPLFVRCDPPFVGHTRRGELAKYFPFRLSRLVAASTDARSVESKSGGSCSDSVLSILVLFPSHQSLSFCRCPPSVPGLRGLAKASKFLVDWRGQGLCYAGRRSPAERSSRRQASQQL